MSYAANITFNDDGTLTYDEITMLDMKEFDEPFSHSDRNPLHKVD